jgi:polynucleotide 5'-kinase involved in rRNA processing
MVIVSKLILFCVGAPSNSKKAKTIMLVGATGTGKSTLVDGIVNYVLGVKWEDSFRFTVLDLEQEEKDKVKNQVSSCTYK